MAIKDQFIQVLKMIFHLILAIVYWVVNLIAKKVPAVQKYTDEFNKCVDKDGNIDKEKLEEAFKRLFPNHDPQDIKRMVREAWGKCKGEDGKKISLKDNLATLLEFVIKALKNSGAKKGNEAGEAHAKSSALAASGDDVAAAKKEL